MNEPSTDTDLEWMDSVQHVIKAVSPKSIEDADKRAEDWTQQEKNRSIQSAFRDLSSQLGTRYSWEAVKEIKAFTLKQQEAVDRVKRVAVKIADMVTSGRGVVFYGPVGTGKDHMQAHLLFRAVQAGLNSKWVSGQDLYGVLRDRMDQGRQEEELLRDLAKPQILAISDPTPPTGELSSWRLEWLYRLTDRRYRQRRGTWMTINATNVNQMDSKLSAQVWDRVQEQAEVIPCFWESYRGRKPSDSQTI